MSETNAVSSSDATEINSVNSVHRSQYLLYSQRWINHQACWVSAQWLLDESDTTNEREIELGSESESVTYVHGTSLIVQS